MYVDVRGCAWSMTNAMSSRARGNCEACLCVSLGLGSFLLYKTRKAQASDVSQIDKYRMRGQKGDFPAVQRRLFHLRPTRTKKKMMQKETEKRAHETNCNRTFVFVSSQDCPTLNDIWLHIRVRMYHSRSDPMRPISMP